MSGYQPALPDTVPNVMQPFSITAPIPEGTTLIEASAGTGKTWTLAALVTRFVAEEELPLDELLVVTFSRAASQELRERVRGQLEDTLHRLGAPAGDDDDELVTALRGGGAEAVDQRRARLARALATFDSATIATIHQFCHYVLKSLGVAGDSDPYATLVEDTETLRQEVVDDVFLRFSKEANFTLDYEEAQKYAKATLDNSTAEIGPVPPPAHLETAIAFSRAVREEYARRKRRGGILEYDDLLSQLRSALNDENSPARDRMRERWSVVLVDEFQDTDPVQWEVFSRAFGEKGRSLILVGDPKQAIYAFRGGDVQTYLSAAKTAVNSFTLPTNYRSDAPLVESLQTLMSGVQLSPGIVTHRVDAAQHTSRLGGQPGQADAPVELRWVPESGLAVGLARSIVLRDVAAKAAQLLAGETSFDGEPLAPHHLAVLCRTNSQLVEVREYLRELGIPAVMMSSESVLRSSAGQWWLELLMALEQPHRPERVRAACLTPLVGWSAERLDAIDDSGVDEAAELVAMLLARFHSGGVPGIVDALRARGMLARLLRRTGGERDVTDIEHCAQLLTARQMSARAGISSLVAWLQEQSAQDAKATADARIMRLDSDALAVTLSTIHSSKGLQYPIVLAPTLWDRYDQPTKTPGVVHRNNRRELSFDPATVNAPEATEENTGEEMRLAYVAMTRAQSGLILWWAGTKQNTSKSALHRLLFGQANGPEALDALLQERADGASEKWLTTTEQNGTPKVDRVREVFAAWAKHGAFTVHEIDPNTVPPHITVRRGDARLAVNTFDDADVDRAWRRTSYSALSAAGEAADELAALGDVTSEPEHLAVRLDEDADVELATPPSPDMPGRKISSPMANQPMGATFGSLVHGVLEEADFQAADLRDELRAHILEQQMRWPADVEVESLADALVAVMHTPFGPLADDVTLRDIVSTDRLPEMDFELPLSGGEEPHPSSTLRAFAPLLREHLDEGDPLRTYADQLDSSALGDELLRGYLTGSIDLTFRHGGRYFVVDYKTNRLGDVDAALTLADYAPSRLVEAMNHSSYPLQAILYSVVLHRYLRWRLPGYNPDEHLGGVMYLYVRGMAGPDTPRENGTPCGVFTWRPPATLVVALSDAVDGVRAGGVR